MPEQRACVECGIRGDHDDRCNVCEIERLQEVLRAVRFILTGAAAEGDPGERIPNQPGALRYNTRNAVDLIDASIYGGGWPPTSHAGLLSRRAQ